MDKLRLRFSKTGRAVYISHLDLMRTMQRSFLRAGYQLKYSEGFNPHAQIAIALPLSVGTESLCELMDFRLEGEPDIAVLPAALTAKMPEGLEALEVYEPAHKVSEIKWLKGSSVFEYDDRPLDAMTELWEKENSIRAEGFAVICGVDEAGRGPLAGPVCAAAVILPQNAEIPWLNDSKKLSEKRREEVFDEIADCAVSFGVAFASVEEIEKFNILNATFMAMFYSSSL